jgi:S1-C subfamily serine protease
VDRVRSSIVRIETVTCDGDGVGTGFVIGPRLIAIVEHVIDGASKITLKQGGRRVGTGVVIGADRDRDVALVRSSRPLRGEPLAIATARPRLGDSVAAIGFPLGLPLSVTRGSISGDARTIPIEGVKRRGLLQTDAAVSPGNSGGPLLSMDSGEVVGLIDASRAGDYDALAPVFAAMRDTLTLAAG